MFSMPITEQEIMMFPAKSAIAVGPGKRLMPVIVDWKSVPGATPTQAQVKEAVVPKIQPETGFNSMWLLIAGGGDSAKADIDAIALAI